MAKHIWLQNSIKEQKKDWLRTAYLYAKQRQLPEELCKVAAVWFTEKRHQGSGVSGGALNVHYSVIYTVKQSTLEKHLDFAKHYERLLNS